MTKLATPVWDLPTRLTHWLFVLCVAFSWWSAEQRLMDWHRYSGYTVLGLLIFRIYWGLAGSSTARFAHFVRRPRAVLEHLRLRREERTRIVGHSPPGSWSVVAMLLVMLTQVTLGLFATDLDGLESGPLSHLVSFDAGRDLAEAHEVTFNVLLALIALHVVAGMAAVDGRSARHARRVDDRRELNLLRHQREMRPRVADLPLIAMETVFGAVRELAESALELRSVLRIGCDARAHDGRRRFPESKHHWRIPPVGDRALYALHRAMDPRTRRVGSF